MIDFVDQKIILQMQEDFPLCPNPYQTIADQVGISETELLSRLQLMKDSGLLRKLGAVLQHLLAGFHGNALCSWQVEPELLERVSRRMAECAFISHVYIRQPHAKWPYNLYTVFHGHSREECLGLIEKTAADLGLKTYQVMFSRKNWKRAQLPLLQHVRGEGQP